MDRVLLLLGCVVINARSVLGACAPLNIATDLNSQGYTSKYAGMAGAMVTYTYVAQPATDFNAAVTTCMQLKAITPSGQAEYGRLAVFPTPATYIAVMSQFSAKSGSMMIGAHNDYNDGSDLNQWYWVQQMVNSRMCYIFSTDGQTPGIAPSQFTLGSITGGTTKPYVLTVDPNDPYHFVPRANSAINLPFMCELGCTASGYGSYNYSSTPQWLAASTAPTSPKSTTTSAASSSPAATSTTISSPSTSSSTSIADASPTSLSSSSSASSSTSSAPATCSDTASTCVYCHPPTTAQTILYSSSCYGFSGNKTANFAPSFDNAYAKCHTTLVRNIGEDHGAFLDGRVATFRTPTDLACVMESLRLNGIDADMIVGAAYNWDSVTGDHTWLSNYNWMNGTLNETWQHVSSGSWAIDTVTRLESVPLGFRPILYMLVNPSKQFQFFSHYENSTASYPVLCELGCTPLTQTYYTSTEQNSWENIYDGAQGKIKYTKWSELCASVGVSGCDPPVTTTLASTTLASTTTPSTTYPSDCAKSYTQTSSCVSEMLIASYPGIAVPQDCADLCSANARCRSFNFRLGDATCTQNDCELFDRISSEVTDPPSTTSGVDGECFHYDSVV